MLISIAPTGLAVTNAKAAEPLVPGGILTKFCASSVERRAIMRTIVQIRTFPASVEALNVPDSNVPGLNAPASDATEIATTRLILVSQCMYISVREPIFIHFCCLVQID